MFNVNQERIYSETLNGDACLQYEPDIGQRIDLPSSIHVSAPELFTALYWLTRWNLQGMVGSNPYYNPTWNTFSAGGFANTEFARFVNTITETALASNANRNTDFVNEFVIPFIEMDCADRWHDAPQVAQRYLDQAASEHCFYWKAQKDSFVPPRQQQNFGFNNQQQQRQQQNFGSTFARSNQQQQRQGGSTGLFSRQESGTSFNSVNQQGIRTTTSAGERNEAPRQQQSNAWSSRSATGQSKQGNWEPKPTQEQTSSWGGRSSQQKARDVASGKAEPKTNPLDDALPMTEWSADELHANEPLNSLLPQQQGGFSMGQEVTVTEAVSHTNGGLPVNNIMCPVLRTLAQETYGDYLPRGFFQTPASDDAPYGMLAIPSGLNEMPVVFVNSDDVRGVAHDSTKYVLLDMLQADYNNQTIVATTVAIESKDGEMDYSKHILNSAIKPVEPVHHVDYAAMVKPEADESLAGLVSELGTEEVSTETVPYKLSTDMTELNARLTAQSASAMKSYEVFGKVVKPFVVEEGFDHKVMERLNDYTTDDFESYLKDLETLPRDLNLYISGKLFNDAQFVLSNKFNLDTTISEFGDVAELEGFIEEAYPHLKDEWMKELARMMSSAVRIVPETMVDEALKVIADVEALADVDVHNLVLLEEEKYSLYLPYTLSELNITSTSNDHFKVTNAAFAGLHDVMYSLFKRFNKTNIDRMTLFLADGTAFTGCALSKVAKTYLFRQIG